MKLFTHLSCLTILPLALGSAPAPSANSTTQPSPDKMLESAIGHPSSFMFTEATTSRADEPGYELIITSARGINGTPETVRVLSGSMRVFRPDTDRDEFTKKGGWYWHIKDTQGKSQLSKPGALILVVRDLDGTVHWYSLDLDLRC